MYITRKKMEYHRTLRPKWLMGYPGLTPALTNQSGKFRKPMPYLESRPRWLAMQSHSPFLRIHVSVKRPRCS